MFAASPRASDSRPFSRASMASPRSIIETTSASEIQSGASRDIFELLRAISWIALLLLFAHHSFRNRLGQRRTDGRFQGKGVCDQCVHYVTTYQHQDGDSLFMADCFNRFFQLSSGLVSPA